MAEQKKHKLNINIGGLATTVVFIILKVMPNGPLQNLDWIWVLGPLWIPLAITIAALLAFGIIALIVITVIEISKFVARI